MVSEISYEENSRNYPHRYDDAHRPVSERERE
jgi:hypothetical protein